ncbi:hypothetical protein AQV86_05740 [Nanohaloarchaea archaeon SG9]|nr:hypothetical protein AQV86_05740 [Nanohaloarchaea archaeon SG9]
MISSNWKKSKGQGGMPVKIIVGLLIAIIIGVFMLMFLLPTIRAQEQAASCTGILRSLGTILADMTGVSLC